MPGAGNEPIRIFVSYARKDRRWLDEDNPHNLIPWLIDSLRKHNVVFWYDQDLVPSEVYSQRIADEIARADIAILMVSQRFLNSVYIEQNELPPIKERARQGTLSVLPILLERCAWEEDEFLLSRQMLPGKPTPLIKYIGNDAEWTEVRGELLDGIKTLIRTIRTARLQGRPLPAGPAPSASDAAEAPASETPQEAPAPAPPAEIPDAGLISGRFCVLELESDPPGAEVVIDGGAFEAKTPDKIKRVPWGRRHYDAVLEGERRLSYFDVRDFACRVLIEFPQAQQRRADQQAENALWERTAQAGTEEGYAAYLAESRLGLHRAEAEGRIAELAAERARREEEERKRLEKEAAAERARQTAERKEEALWAAAREADSEESYAGYLQLSRLLTHKDEAVRRGAELAAEREKKLAERKEAALWRKAAAEDTEESYAAYLAGSRLLANQAQAQARSEELRAERVRREEEKTRKRREREAAAKEAREQQERAALEKARREAEALAARQAEERRQAELKRQREAELAREKARRDAEAAAAAKREAEAREAERLRKLEEQRERERIEAEAQKRRAEQIARQQQKEEIEAAAALKEQERKQAELRRSQEEARTQARLPKLVSFIRPLVPVDEGPREPPAAPGHSLGSWFKGLLGSAHVPVRRDAKREMEKVLGAMTKIGARRADADKAMQTVLDSMLKIEAREVEMQALTDEQVRVRVSELRARLARGATPDEVLVDAFAAVMSACRRLSGRAITVGADQRTWKYVPTRDQLACAIVMMQRKVTEAPAEAEHRMAVLAPACLHALAGRGVHVVAATDEKAAQDAHSAAVVHGYLGLTVGCLRPDQATDERRAQYACDITFGSVAEFCADHLRDSMARRAEDQVQRGLHAAIVCDADSVLIDEAFTSRTISRLEIVPPGQSPHARLRPAVEALIRAQKTAPAAQAEDQPYVVDHKARTVSLTDRGRQVLRLSEGDLPAVHALLRAYCLYRRDVDYIVEDNRVVIVDGTTGCALRGYRWSDGLHQAVEAKEGLAAMQELETFRSVTHRGYFRLYSALAGLAAGVEEDAADYEALYQLGVFAAPAELSGPPPVPGTSIYRTKREAYHAAVEETAQRNRERQPVMVCVSSIEGAELFSRMLRRQCLPHSVLTARCPAGQAEIIRSQAAALPGAVTIATGIVTRGTQIQSAAGEAGPGLHRVILERHPVRRVDLEWPTLAGAGSSHFLVSLEDDLLRWADSRRIAQILGGAAPVEGEELKQEALAQLVEQAQKEAGEALSRARRREVAFDDILHEHREALRRECAEDVATGAVRARLLGKVSALITTKAQQSFARGPAGVAGFSAWVEAQFPVAFKPSAPSDAETLARTVVEAVRKAYELKSAGEKPEDLAAIERHLYLDAVDGRWRAYLREVDRLRADAGDLAGARRITPEEFARGAVAVFDSFRQGVAEDIASRMFRAVTPALWTPVNFASRENPPKPLVAAPIRRDVPRVGRNDPCPCGSGKKYKACCGREG